VTLFVPLGVVILLGGLALLVTGIRHHREQNPTHVAMLIGGMMMTAFGLIIAGFAIAYNRAAPLDLNASSVPTP
jgi:Co/Zn/Cd efflux system component